MRWLKLLAVPLKTPPHSDDLWLIPQLAPAWSCMKLPCRLQVDARVLSPPQLVYKDRRGQPNDQSSWQGHRAPRNFETCSRMG